MLIQIPLPSLQLISFTIYDTDDQKGIIKEVCKKLSIDTKMLKERTILGAIISQAILCVRARVFPLPAPASTSTGPVVVMTAFFCSSFNVS